MKKLILLFLSFILLSGCKIYFITVNQTKPGETQRIGNMTQSEYTRFVAVYGCRSSEYLYLDSIPEFRYFDTIPKY